MDENRDYTYNQSEPEEKQEQTGTENTSEETTGFTMPQDDQPAAEPESEEYSYGSAEGDTASSEPDYEFVQSYTTEAEKTKHRREKKKKEKKHMGSKGKIAIIVIIAVILSGCFGFGGAALYDNVFNSSSSGSSNEISRTEGYTLEDATGSNQTVAEIAEQNEDAVVEIATESVTTDSWYGQYVTEGAGSGVIIDSDEGYIITNNHVVEGASTVKVTLHNGDEYDAEVIGTDSTNDIAVIQIDAKDLTAATYGNSDQLEVGELAVAIGNPLGELGGTVTSGIISALDRQVTIDDQKMTLLQTDASINPGNSGGGLFNQDGQLIGIVCAKSSGTDVEGLGFAIPINTAAEVAQQIIKTGGDVTVGTEGNAAIGVTVANINSDELAEQYNVDKQGVYISSITSTNAQDAGFQIGDRIVKFDGKKVTDYDKLSELLSKHKSGDKVEVVVERNGKKVTLTTELTTASTTDSSSSQDQQEDGNQYYSNPYGQQQIPNN